MKDESVRRQSGGRERTPRQRVIESILVKSRFAAGLVQLTEVETVGAVNSWDEVLDRIPTDWLNECYKRAMRTRTKSGPLQPGELAAVWNEVNATGEVKAGNQTVAQSTAERCPEFECDASGWIVTDSRGKLATGDYSGVTYARPCPIHRAKGVQR